MNPDPLKDQLKERKVKISHENNEQNILLTAKPKELQKFMRKYLNSKEAFDDGVEYMLFPKKD